MVDICLSRSSILCVEFSHGGDLMLKLIHDNGENGREVAGSLLLGDEKRGMMGNSTPVQDSLLYLWAPLAAGRNTPISPETVTNKFLRFATARPGDHISVSADQLGALAFRIEGQDMGVASNVDTMLQYSELPDEAAQAVYFSLHRLLKQYGEPFKGPV